ncbi:hypothetical protein E2562_025807, partial [Oryza meyeriana var. granulata]
WPEDEPLVEDVNMNAFRDELANALFHGVPANTNRHSEADQDSSRTSALPPNPPRQSKSHPQRHTPDQIAQHGHGKGEKGRRAHPGRNRRRLVPLLRLLLLPHLPLFHGRAQVAVDSPGTRCEIYWVVVVWSALLRSGLRLPGSRRERAWAVKSDGKAGSLREFLLRRTALSV